MKRLVRYFAAGSAICLGLVLAVPPAARSQDKVDWQAVKDDYEKGRDAFQKKDFSRAKKLFDDVLSHDPDHAGANRYLGRIYFEHYHDYRKAIRYLEKAVSLASGSYKRDPLYSLAQSYEEVREYRKALSAWEEYVKYTAPGSKWETEAKARIADLRAHLQPAKP
jgi:cytochrome c-type biogenesis protein CcmH/NrfG